MKEKQSWATSLQCQIPCFKRTATRKLQGTWS
jgi:hypothetical protein